MNYELTLLARSDINVDDVANALANIMNIISSNSSEVLYTEYWGLRDLAYQISKKSSAHYYFIQYSGNQEVNDLLNDRIKISDIFIRHLIIKSEDESKIGKKTNNAVESKSDEHFGIIFDDKYYNILKNIRI